MKGEDKDRPAEATEICGVEFDEGGPVCTLPKGHDFHSCEMHEDRPNEAQAAPIDMSPTKAIMGTLPIPSRVEIDDCGGIDVYWRDGDREVSFWWFCDPAEPALAMRYEAGQRTGEVEDAGNHEVEKALREWLGPPSPSDRRERVPLEDEARRYRRLAQALADDSDRADGEAQQDDIERAESSARAFEEIAALRNVVEAAREVCKRRAAGGFHFRSSDAALKSVEGLTKALVALPSSCDPKGGM